MGLRFTVLASGSGGNATLVECDGFGLLIDAGLGPRQLAARLTAVGASWASIHALLLTHTHSDHWNDRTLAHLVRRRVPVYCQPGAPSRPGDMVPQLRVTEGGTAGPRLRGTGRFHSDAGAALPGAAGQSRQRRYLRLSPGRPARPVRTFLLYRLRRRSRLLGRNTGGSAGVDVDLLALEFNHDVHMECASGRTAALIARVLGDQGHLSNDQAAALLREVLRRSRPGRLRHVVQLHPQPRLKRGRPWRIKRLGQCWTPIACTGQVHTARQDEVCTTIDLGAACPRKPRAPRRTAARSKAPLEGPTQACLPGFGED